MSKLFQINLTFLDVRLVIGAPITNLTSKNIKLIVSIDIFLVFLFLFLFLLFLFVF